MFIAMNRFKVIKGCEAAFEQVWLSRVRMIFDIPLFVRFLMMAYPGVDLEIVRADVIGNPCSLSARRRNPPRLNGLLAGRFDVHRCRRDIASLWREASVRPQLGCQK